MNDITTSRVLVVDDDLDIQEVLKIKLERSGYAVILAGDGDEALMRVESDHPDLVILDIKMPGLDGLEVCRRLRQKEAFQTLPILLVTAYGGVDHIIAGLDAGADDYVTKPFHPEEVLMRVRSLLRMKKTERELKEKEILLARTEAVGELLVTLAHHVNNSLAVLTGRAQATVSDDPAAVKLKEVCLRQSQRIQAVLQSLEELVGRMKLDSVSYANSDLKMYDVEEDIRRRLKKEE